MICLLRLKITINRFRPCLFFLNKLLLPLFTSFLCGRAEEHVCFFSDKRASFLFFPLPKCRHLLPLITSSFTSYLFIHKPYISFSIFIFLRFRLFFYVLIRFFTFSSVFLRFRPFFYVFARFLRFRSFFTFSTIFCVFVYFF